MLPIWFLSLWISNVATAALMLPCTTAVLLQMAESKKQMKRKLAANLVKTSKLYTDIRIIEHFSSTLFFIVHVNAHNYMHTITRLCVQVCACICSHMHGKHSRYAVDKYIIITIYILTVIFVRSVFYIKHL